MTCSGLVGKIKNYIVNAAGSFINPATSDIQTDGTQKTRITDGTDDASVGSNGGLDVNVIDQRTEIINLQISIKLEDLIIITSGLAINDTALTINTLAVTPVVGNIACLKEGTAFCQGQILTVVANGVDWDITLDTPLDFAFTVAGGCSLRSADLSVDGSVTPVTAFLGPGGTTADWDITRLLLHMEDGSSMDSGLFGSLPKLTKGVVLRVSNGVTKNFANVKSNGEIGHTAYDIAYDDKAPSGVYGLRSRFTLTKLGVVLRLEQSTADEVQVIIQDDLTGLDTFRVIAQGHLVEPN